MPTPRPLVAGNWKMNGQRDDGMRLALGIVAHLVQGGGMECDLLICPPATLLAEIGQAIAGSPLALGGQDCHTAQAGAHTGDISAAMLADVGCRYVIVGHSERRADHGEGDATVRAKAEAALAVDLVPIVCVGETEAERDAGQALAVVAGQLAGSLPDGADAARLVVAYEPVWAIGTGRTPIVAEIAEVHACLRAALRERMADGESVRLLYGGSVKPANAAEILAVENVNGALVGGASLKAEDFCAIARACG